MNEDQNDLDSSQFELKHSEVLENDSKMILKRGTSESNNRRRKFLKSGTLEPSLYAEMNSMSVQSGLTI